MSIGSSIGTKRSRRSPARRPWKPAVRVMVSVLLAAHLLAVFTPPFAFQTSPIRGLGSPLAETAMRTLGPYIDFVYLNHGYAFFAPDPGPSHLLRATLEFSDGRPPRVITLPDLERDWPRLLYHRHFMLSEHLNAAFAPPEPPADLAGQPRGLANWRYVREMYEARREAIERHLLDRHGADRARLVRIEHRLLDPFERADLGKSPADPETYIELPEDGGGSEVP